MSELGAPYGRQPERTTITPSNQNPWVTWGPLDQRFTREQLNELKRFDLDPEGLEVVTVRRTASQREMYWGPNQMAPYFEFECPVIRRRRDGKLEVISPGGWKKLVPPDGWVTSRPKIKLGSWSW